MSLNIRRFRVDAASRLNESVFEKWTHNAKENFDTLMNFLCPLCSGSVEVLPANADAVRIFNLAMQFRQLWAKPHYITPHGGKNKKLVWIPEPQTPMLTDFENAKRHVGASGESMEKSIFLFEKFVEFKNETEKNA